MALLLLLGSVWWAPPLARAQSIPQVFQQVKDTVVTIRAKGRELSVQSGGSSTLVKHNEVGSGVLVSADGKVLTAAHVVQIADEVTVDFLGGQSVAARVVASEAKADLALLQLESVPPGVTPARIGDSSRPLKGLGFVVSSNMARELMLEKRRFWSGVTWFRVSGELAEMLNLPQPFGLAVEEVAKNSPAEALGLRPSRVVARIEGKDVPLGGDIVLSAMGIPIKGESSFDKIRDRWAELIAGDEMRFTVLRAGRVIELKGQLPETGPR